MRLYQIRPCRATESGISSEGLALAAIRAYEAYDPRIAAAIEAALGQMRSAETYTFAARVHLAAASAIDAHIADRLLDRAPRTPVELAAEALRGLTDEAIAEAVALARKAGVR